MKKKNKFDLGAFLLLGFLMLMVGFGGVGFYHALLGDIPLNQVVFFASILSGLNFAGIYLFFLAHLRLTELKGGKK